MNTNRHTPTRTALARVLVAPLLLAAAWSAWLYARTRREMASIDHFDQPWFEDEIHTELRSRPH